MKRGRGIIVGWGLLVAACNADSIMPPADIPSQRPPTLARAAVPPPSTHPPSAAVPAPERYVAVIVPAQGVDLTPRIAGELRAVHVRPGARINAGTPIADIDARTVREELAVAEAVLHAARVALQQAEIDVMAAEQVLATEKQAVARGLSARQNLDKAQFAMARAQAAQAHARAAIIEQDTRVNTVRSRLQDTQLVAPFAGMIAEWYREPGARVDPSTPLVRLITSDALRVRFAVPLAHAQRLHVTQAVSVDIATIVTPLRAGIHYIAPELDPASRLIVVEANLMAPTGIAAKVYPGTAAWVTLPQ